MDDSGAGKKDPAGQSTVLRLVVDGHFLDRSLTLETTVNDTGAWVFDGTAHLDLSLGDVLHKIISQEFPAGHETGLTVLPSHGDVVLDTLTVRYRTKPEVLSAQGSIDLRPDDGPNLALDIVFARAGSVPDGEGASGSAAVVLGLQSRGRIDLSSLAGSESGIIGQFLGGLSLDQLGVFYASDDIAATSGDLFGEHGGAPHAFAKGPSFSARLGIGESFTDILLPSLKEPPVSTTDEAGEALPLVGPEAPKPPVPADAKADGPMRYWKDLDKTLGPLQVRRIGGEWTDGKLGILLDASVSLLGLEIGLSGLCVRVQPSKLTSLTFADLDFGLDGLELDFVRGPVAISGMLLKTRQGARIGYAGMASIRAGTFSIAAIGAYSTTAEGKAAFFIFGAFSGLLGGPPCFVVEGIAAGFGYNRAINLPDIDSVQDFPLVSIVRGQSPGKATSVMQDPEKDFPAVTGQYWIAAGVKFSSFKLIETFALVTVQFGTRFEIALLGVATMRQPPAPAKPTLVYVEMAMKVRFAPDDGLLLVAAQLTTNSYLFDPSCKLTGGFAFCVWFKPSNPTLPDHSGDFVVTLGGYHPKFQPPDHYPRVPRVGFNWLLPHCGVTITGEAYFALTPSFLMAGARFSVVFRSGDFSAWFEVHADFLIGWAPLHYEAEVGIRIGAAFVLRIGSIKITLSFELQALLRIWGPPFAGEAYVNLGIVAFTIPIGDRTAPRKVPILPMQDFKDHFLPERPLSIAITAGLIEEQTGERSGAAPFAIVNPTDLRLSIESFVPISDRMLWNGVALADAPAACHLGIRPMGPGSLKSSLDLTLMHGAAKAEGMAFRTLLKNVPEALWSPTPMPDDRTSATLKSNVIGGVPMGIQILPAECRKFHSNTVAISISQTGITLQAAPDATMEHAPFIEPINRQQRFRAAWKSPDAKTIDAIRAAGFDLPGDVIKLTQGDAGWLPEQPSVSASEPADPDLWIGVPFLVGIDQLPPQTHKA